MWSGSTASRSISFGRSNPFRFSMLLMMLSVAMFQSLCFLPAFLSLCSNAGCMTSWQSTAVIWSRLRELMKSGLKYRLPLKSTPAVGMLSSSTSCSLRVICAKNGIPCSRSPSLIRAFFILPVASKLSVRDIVSGYHPKKKEDMCPPV